VLVKKTYYVIWSSKIRETLNNHFEIEEGELRVVFRSKGLNIWEFLGIFKFAGKDKPDYFERQDMPDDCFTNCYERISDELKLKEEMADKFSTLPLTIQGQHKCRNATT